MTRALRDAVQQFILRDYGDGTLTLEELKRRRPDIAEDLDREIADLERFVADVLARLAETETEQELARVAEHPLADHGDLPRPATSTFGGRCRNERRTTK